MEACEQVRGAVRYACMYGFSLSYSLGPPPSHCGPSPFTLYGQAFQCFIFHGNLTVFSALLQLLYRAASPLCMDMQVRTELLSSTGAAPNACVCSRLDLEVLASVRSFATSQRLALNKAGKGRTLDILVNNAGQ